MDIRIFTPAAGEIVRHQPVDSPDVSVVMAVKDGERFLEKSVRSILGQTLSNLELIVVDDGSTDRTPEILDRFGDARMKIVTQPARGLADALNRGISMARSGLIAIMEADGIAVPDRLAKERQVLDSDPEIGLVGSATTVIDESGGELRQWSPAISDREIRNALIRSNQFAHGSVMFRKSVFDAVGGYSRLPFAQDYDLWLRMAGMAKLANLDQPLVYQRAADRQPGAGHEPRQIRSSLRAQFGAVKRGDYSPLAARHMFRPAVASMMPGRIRELVIGSGDQQAA